MKDKATEEDVKAKNPNKWVSAEMLNGVVSLSVGPVGTTGISLEKLASGPDSSILACDQSEVVREKYPDLSSMSDMAIRFPRPDESNFNNNHYAGGMQVPTYCIGDESYIGETLIYGGHDRVYIQKKYESPTELCQGVCYIVYNNKLYVGQNASVSIYDSDFNLIAKRTTPASKYIVYIYPLSSTDFIAIGQSHGLYSDSTYQTSGIIIRTTNEFETYSISTIDGSQSFGPAPCFFLGSSPATSSIRDLNRPFSIISRVGDIIYSSISTSISYAYYSEATVQIIKSTDFGLTWTKFGPVIYGFTNAVFGIVDGIGYWIGQGSHHSGETLRIKIEKIDLNTGEMLSTSTHICPGLFPGVAVNQSTLVGQAYYYTQSSNTFRIALGFCYIGNGVVTVSAQYVSGRDISAIMMFNILTERFVNLSLGNYRLNGSLAHTSGFLPCGDYACALIYQQPGDVNGAVSGGMSNTYIISYAPTLADTYERESGLDGVPYMGLACLAIINRVSMESILLRCPPASISSIPAGEAGYSSSGLTQFFKGPKEIVIPKTSACLFGTSRIIMSFNGGLSVDLSKAILPYIKNGYIKAT